MMNTIKDQMEKLGPADKRWSALMGLRIRAKLLEGKLGETMDPVRYALEELVILEELDELMEGDNEHDQ